MAKATFNKYVMIKFDTGSYPADTRSVLTRTFTDAVVDAAGNPDPSQIFVSYNGQRIQRRIAEPIASFARFYYELTNHTNTSFTISVHANSAYTNSGYQSASPLTFEIQDNDLFFVDYTHQVTI